MDEAKPVEAKITAKDILRLLRDRYIDSREWVVASEVQRTTGWSDRRYDFVAMNCFASTGHRIEVVEIKVSKSDLRRELESPEKHNVIFDDIDFYSLAAPADIIDMAIIPPKWGVYAYKNGKLITKRKPLALHDEHDRTISRSFVASFMRAAAAQNLDKGIIGIEQQKAFQEGYDKAKKDIGQMADSWDNYKRLMVENHRYSELLGELGIYGHPNGNGSFEGELSQKKWETRKRWVRLMEKLDMDSLAFYVGECHRHLKGFEDSLDIIKSLQQKVLKESKENDIQGEKTNDQ